MTFSSHEGLPARYEVRKILGKGGMGEVLLAYDTQLKRKVAIKLLLDKWQGASPILTRFRREARVQAGLSHPNIVGLYECELDEPPYYLVMEYVEGESLDQRILRGEKLSHSELLRLARELAAGVDELHRQGVLHRDLKPANVMMRERDGAAVVMDLGLVRPQDETCITEEGVLVGTPFYMPPDVLQGRTWSPAGDQYQVAAILFEAATCKNHFPLAHENIETVRTIMRGDWDKQLFQQLPKDLQGPIWRGLLPNQADRFPSLASFRGAVMGEETEAASPLEVPGTLVGLDQNSSRGTAGWRGFFGFFLAAFLGVSLGLAPVPQGESWRSGEDSLDVMIPHPVPAGLALEVDGFSKDVERIDSSQGVVVRWPFPAEATGQSRARLRWSGGVGSDYEFSFPAPAVGDGILLDGAGTVLVPIERPCLFWWQSEPETRWVLLPGRARVPVPVADDPVALWSESGRVHCRSLPWRRLARNSIRKLRRVLEGSPLDALRQKEPTLESRRVLEDGRRRWLPLIPWLPRLLTDWLPRSERIALFEEFQAWQRSAVLERWHGGRPTDLQVPYGEAGYRALHGDPTYSVFPSADEVPSIPLHRMGTQGEGLPVVKVRREGFSVDVTNAPGAWFEWPGDAPRKGLVDVRWRVHTHHRAIRVQLRPKQPADAPVLEGFSILPTPETLPGSSPPSRNHDVSLTLPADLLPAPGSRVTAGLIGLGPEFTPEAQVGPIWARPAGMMPNRGAP